MSKILNCRICDHIFFKFLFCCCRCAFRKRILCCLFSIIIFFVVFVIILTYLSFNKCSLLEVERAVFTICDKYQNREALGNLCPDLCELRTLKPINCLPNHLGKDVVFEATYFEKHVVMKSSKLNSDEFDQIFFKDEDSNRIYPNVDSFYSMVHNSVERNLNITLDIHDGQPLDLLTKLWTKNMQNFKQLPISMQNVAMSNIWFLIQQTEYLLLKYYADKQIFPKIIGTCGPFYVVEFIEPLDNLFLVFYPVWKKDFLERASLALKVLEFLEKTEKHFPFLHICDVKVGHFGFDENVDVKLLDMDMVFFEPTLIQNMIAIKNCTNDQDCNFIDCKGLCNPSQQRCEAKVLNTNFQRVCINVFAGRFMQSYFGLLSSPPRSIANEMYNLLKKCSDPLDDGHIVARQLKQLLEKVVMNSNLSG